MIGACALALASLPIMLGHIGLSWDALNHHIYLGWTAEQPRFDRDYLAASHQSYQYPYLYLPVYKLAAAGATGAMAGVVLALLQVLAVPAVWRMARTCIPGREWFHLAMRAVAVGLAFVNGVVMSMFDSTANDLMATIPLLWAIALALEPVASPGPDEGVLRRAVRFSGFLAGLSIAFKFSNGPLAILLPVLWLWPVKRASTGARLLVEGGLYVVLGFLVAYGYWGWQLWTHFGNPFYPIFDDWFEPLRWLSGWTHDPF